MGDIVVTATRTTSSVQKTPVAVTALDADTIKRLQITNVKDIGQIAPNVQISQVTGGSAGISPYIRGGGVTDGANITSEADVGIYIDDVYQPRAAASIIDALDIDRIEVLRGPQGTLYGRNSASGALKIVTKTPSDQLHAGVEVGTGSWNERMVKGVVSGPLNADGSLRGGISAMYRGNDGGRQYDATLGKGVGGQDFAGTMANLYYKQGGISARLSGFYSHYTSDGQYTVAIDPSYTGNDYLAARPTSGNYRTVLSPSPSFTRDTQYGANLNVSVELGGGAQLTSITAWSHLSDGWREDFSGGVAYTALGVNLPGYAALYDRTAFMHDDNVSQELQLHGSTLGDRLSYVGGLYYFREWGNQQYATTTYFVPSNTRFDILTNSYAAFGQLGFKITPALTLSLGGRYTQDCKSIDALVDTSPVNRKDNWQNFVPKVGLDWQIASQVMAYASLSEGFKAGGYNGLAGSAAQLNSPYGPAKVKAYEVGFKSQFWDRRAKLNVSAFYNDYSSIQQQFVTATGDFQTATFAATHKGVEAEFSLRPLPPLTLWVNGTYNDAHYKGLGTNVSTAANYNGNAMTNVFPYQVTLGTDLALPVAAGRLVLGVNANLRADYYSTPDNAWIGHVPSTQIFNAYVGYEQGPWSVHLTGKNLTDQRYWTTGFAFAQVMPRFTADPMTWRLTFAYKL
ncbi:TonB-dependent receptor [Novosphingobium sp.]|uniref:TonB-dependent receptor n=1 Tax=Novosphingobium sp. TaxID=1874826 RepID=UPI0031DF4DB7